ncbi:MAG: hypothetical protein ABSH25_01555 [Syntrophorhabdales bacterium]|jgi:hypothetical protein
MAIQIDEAKERTRKGKHLYLAIEGENALPLPAHESLARFEANLLFNEHPRSSGNSRLEIVLDSRDPRFVFWLTYRNPVEAHFDAATTFLSKAYNLQHLDLTSTDSADCSPLEWRVSMIFPCPAEYGGITEYDIYGKFSHNSVRALPLFSSCQRIESASPGLVCIEGKRSFPGEDGIGIIVSGAANHESRSGWLSVDPASFFQEYIGFKNELLNKHSREGGTF